MDFLNKTLIGEYSFTDINKDRSYVKRVMIDGRKYFKTGIKTATTVVAFQYKVFNPSINRSEYITLMGVARQHPGDINVSLEEGYEIAATNAMITPVASFTFPTECSARTIRFMMQTYVDELPINFIQTQEELHKKGQDITRFNRAMNKNLINDKYYTNYYKDMCNYNNLNKNIYNNLNKNIDIKK